MQALLSVVIGTVIYIAVVTATEFVAPLERYPLSSKLRGVFFSIANAVGAYVLVLAFYRLWSLVGIRSLVVVPVRGWMGTAIGIVLALLFFDFMNYWNHRFLHRFLWSVHRLHHCQTELHAANAYAHFTERILRDVLFIVPLSLIDFQFPQIPLAIIAVREMLELYIHSPTEIHFGPLRSVLVDNRYHRIHHSTDAAHFDKNFGILFSLWDRLFGTAYHPTSEEWPATGVFGVKPPRSLIDYVLFPLLQRDQPPSNRRAQQRGKLRAST